MAEKYMRICPNTIDKKPIIDYSLSTEGSLFVKGGHFENRIKACKRSSKLATNRRGEHTND
ncbi:MAG: hypothetical protein A2826_02255 [Candidatus Doudnabacteria bacterium RIFCSPHIGHO2_01_FULL_43_23]|uniref:Uncharacterized protein n=1 Tax=Candidatus Doudnabacteria bacterium RIFCSPHIGHO2_01_FULL_43_23 TaxID=1817822 RepID=A0A1F5NS85_9BACT|nr:MAG: hypothetical protein A2826_02255 [Candidatus Doudnabacteria bacterium RIFCSPHIGHO2_01_FULL_43_23]